MGDAVLAFIDLVEQVDGVLATIPAQMGRSHPDLQLIGMGVSLRLQVNVVVDTVAPLPEAGCDRHLETHQAVPPALGDCQRVWASSVDQIGQLAQPTAHLGRSCRCAEPSLADTLCGRWPGPDSQKDKTCPGPGWPVQVLAGYFQVHHFVVLQPLSTSLNRRKRGVW